MNTYRVLGPNFATRCVAEGMTSMQNGRIASCMQFWPAPKTYEWSVHAMDGCIYMYVPQNISFSNLWVNYCQWYYKPLHLILITGTHTIRIVHTGRGLTAPYPKICKQMSPSRCTLRQTGSFQNGLAETFYTHLLPVTVMGPSFPNDIYRVTFC